MNGIETTRGSRRFWRACALALTLLPAGVTINISSAIAGDDKVEVRMPTSGTWTLERKKGDHFRLETEMRGQGNHWVNNTDVRASELKGLSNGPNVRFEIPREAGTLNFQGSFDGSKGKGTFTFAGNPGYQRQMQGLGYEVSDSRLLELYIHDVSLDFAREMTALGEVSTGKLVELSIHGVTPEYVREMAGLGYKGLSASKLVEFKIHGVSPELVRALVDTGYEDLPPNRVVEFKIHGVTPDYIRGLANAGYRDLPPNKLVEFKIHGVNEKFIRAAESRGYKNLTPNELVELKLVGRLHRRGEDRR